MADIDRVRQQMMEELERKIRSDGRLGSIRNKIQNGDYSEAGQYGTRCGELLSEVIRQNMTEDLFQECDVNGLASMLLPVIEKETEYVSNAVSAAQRLQNQETGIGINPIKPDFDASQYYNIFGKMQAYDSYDEAAWILDEPIVQDSLKTVDESLRENAEFQYKAGLRTCVIREVEPDCCEFCAERAGTYYYPDVPDMVFERHNDCRCEIRIETEKDDGGQDKKKDNLPLIRIPEYPASSVIKKVKSGRYSLRLTWNSYNKHVEGHPDYLRYLESRLKKNLGPQGVLTISKEEAQEIIYKKSGTGIIKLNRYGEPLDFEYITCDKVIGKYYDKGEWYETKKARIDHGKDGSHLIPIKGKNYD